MISLKVLSTATAIAFAASMVLPSASFRPSASRHGRRRRRRCRARGGGGARVPALPVAAAASACGGGGARPAIQSAVAAAVYRGGGYGGVAAITGITAAAAASFPGAVAGAVDRRRYRLAELRLLWRARLLRARVITTTVMSTTARLPSRPHRVAMTVPTASSGIAPTIRGRAPISAMTACGTPARNRRANLKFESGALRCAALFYERSATATPPSVTTSAVISRRPSGSCSIAAAASTPTTGTSKVPIDAVAAGSLASAANQQT